MPITRHLDALPVLRHGVFLHPSAQVIGNVQIGDDNSFWCNAVLFSMAVDAARAAVSQIARKTATPIAHVDLIVNRFMGLSD